MRRAIAMGGLPFTLVALAALMGGCIGCQPLLEVRHCLDTPCPPSPDAVEVDWTAEHAAAWPEIDAFMRKVEEGEHEHRKWTEEKRVALWEAFGVGGEKPELIVHMEGEWYRVRVLRC